MSRYIKGDIEKKISGPTTHKDVEFFGVKGEFRQLTFIFHREDLNKINQCLEQCYQELGPNKKRWEKFLKDLKESDLPGYNDEIVKEYWKKNFKEEVNSDHMIRWYNRADIGEKIKNFLKDEPFCEIRVDTNDW